MFMIIIKFIDFRRNLELINNNYNLTFLILNIYILNN